MSKKASGKPFSTRLPDDVRTTLQSLAESKGLSEGELGRMLLIEKLSEAIAPRTDPTDFFKKCAAVIIASLSDKFDFEEACQLLDQNVTASDESGVQP